MLQVSKIRYCDHFKDTRLSTSILFFFTLQLLAPPIFADTGSRFMMKLIQFSYKEEIEISCNAISAPNELKPVVMQWMKNGRILHEGIDFIYSFIL